MTLLQRQRALIKEIARLGLCVTESLSTAVFIKGHPVKSIQPKRGIQDAILCQGNLWKVGLYRS